MSTAASFRSELARGLLEERTEQLYGVTCNMAFSSLDRVSLCYCPLTPLTVKKIRFRVERTRFLLDNVVVNTLTRVTYRILSMISVSLREILTRHFHGSTFYFVTP